MQRPDRGYHAFDFDLQPAPQILGTPWGLFALARPDLEGLGEIELKPIAMAVQDGLRDVQNQGMLHRHGGMPGKPQKAAEALRLPVNAIAGAKWSIFKMRLQVVVEGFQL
jgi:hypothetical protein